MENQLSERQRIEEAYHDNKYKHDDMSDTAVGPERSYYKFFWELIGDVNNLKVLDFGCGNGWVSIRFAKAGAKVWGIDISGELIKKAKKLAQVEGLSTKISFEKMPAEDLSLPDNFFDLIAGSAILHHTDLNLAVQNIHRVLKPGGRAIFIEPMNQNIFLKIWRALTPWRRSTEERALTERELTFIQSAFPEAKNNFFCFFSIFTEGFSIIFPKSRILFFVNSMVGKIDRYVLKLFPFLGKYCAVVVLELQKSK